MVRAASVGERICHFHFFHGGVIEVFSVLLAKLFLRKVIITVHDVESFGASMLPARVAGAIYGLAHCLIVHNQVCRSEVMAALRVSSEKIRIVPHGNYLHMIGGVFDKAEAQRALGIDAEKKIILFFGQIKEVKGLEVLLKAMPSVVAEQPDAVLLIAGRPWRSDFANYEAMMEQIGIRDCCISHIRYIPDEEVPLYYSACDLVALPYWRIYQSGVVLMAMSYGKAVLVSDLPGMTEIVTHGENGFVFCQGSDQDLASKINEALGDGQRSEQTARRGLKYVQNHHDWVQIGRMTAGVYANCANA
jgi:glycosyltransferase involved in cell wall biosynthesis